MTQYTHAYEWERILSLILNHLVPVGNWVFSLLYMLTFIQDFIIKLHELKWPLHNSLFLLRLDYF